MSMYSRNSKAYSVIIKQINKYRERSFLSKENESENDA